MSQVQVSVIIPVYNGEKYIGRCLRSLRNQAFHSSQFEIIAIDDGSEDGSYPELLKFADFIRIIRNEKNRGLPSALNSALRVARGEFFVRVDCDDYVSVDFLDLLYRSSLRIEKNCVVFCDYYLVDDDEVILEHVSALDAPIGCAALFPMEVLQTVGFYDESLLFQEDLDFRIRCSSVYDFHHLSVPLYRYRRHDKNITNDMKSMAMFAEIIANKHGPIN